MQPACLFTPAVCLLRFTSNSVKTANFVLFCNMYLVMCFFQLKIQLQVMSKFLSRINREFSFHCANRTIDSLNVYHSLSWNLGFIICNIAMISADLTIEVCTVTARHYIL